MRVSFARLLIEVDVTKPVPKVVYIEDAYGGVVEQTVHYDWVPSFCHKCQIAGHDCGKKKPNEATRIKVPKQQCILKAPTIVEAPKQDDVVPVGAVQQPTPSSDMEIRSSLLEQLILTKLHK